MGTDLSREVPIAPVSTGSDKRTEADVCIMSLTRKAKEIP
jgi:hypothetical protein